MGKIRGQWRAIGVGFGEGVNEGVGKEGQWRGVEVGSTEGSMEGGRDVVNVGE